MTGRFATDPHMHARPTPLLNPLLTTARAPSRLPWVQLKRGLAVITLSLSACSKTPAPAPAAPPPSQSSSNSSAADAVGPTHYAWLSAELEQAEQRVQNLVANNHRLLESPSAERLGDAQQAWQEARDALETQALAMRLHQTGDPAFLSLQQWHSDILTWPIAPGALDRFETYEFSGLVFDIQLPLTPEALRAAHRQMGESEAVLGLYPIGYLLYGDGRLSPVQALQAVDALSQAHREAGIAGLEEVPNNRRRRLLALQVAALHQDLLAFKRNWLRPEVESAVTSLSPKSWRMLAVRLVADAMAGLGDFASLVEPTVYDRQAYRLHIERVAVHAKVIGELVPALELANPEATLALVAQLRAPEPDISVLTAQSLETVFRRLSDLTAELKLAPALQ